MQLDGGAGRNKSMFRKVKKDDLILIPHLPCLGQITVARATEDWEKGYQFSVFTTGDHGHIFPAEPLKNFHRSNLKIPASLRGTFRNPCRFWNIGRLRKDIEDVLELTDHDLQSSSSVVDRWQQHIADAFAKHTLQHELFESAVIHFGKSEWEYLLTDALQRLNPGWKVERRGGKTEAQHGTDILVKIPDLFGDGYYGVAIQVKDYQGWVSDRPIEQILKAEKDYWKNQDITIVELVVVVTGGHKKDNAGLLQSADEKGVRIIWSSDIEELVYRSACRFMSDPDRQIPSSEQSTDGEQDPSAE